VPLWVPTLVLFGVNGFFWCCVYDREQKRFLRQKLVGVKQLRLNKRLRGERKLESIEMCVHQLSFWSVQFEEQGIY
jgi:hypothetical protein